VVRLDVKEGEEVEISRMGSLCRLPVSFRPLTSTGTAGLPAGRPDLSGFMDGLIVMAAILSSLVKEWLRLRPIRIALK
jgi:hypothetical protein